jgi:hypothetical protein
MTFTRFKACEKNSHALKRVIFTHLTLQCGELLGDPRYAARFATTKNGKQYFVGCYTGNASEGTVVVFISPNLKHLLGTADEFHLDGHFKMTPALADVYQLMTVMPVAFDHASI